MPIMKIKVQTKWKSSEENKIVDEIFRSALIGPGRK